MPAPSPLYIAVVGASSASDAQLAAAETVGRTLGEAGATVITGGRSGVMEAASRGAASAGATTIGLLPGSDRHEDLGRDGAAIGPTYNQPAERNLTRLYSGPG